MGRLPVLAGMFLAFTMAQAPLALGLGVAVGAMFAMGMLPARGAYVDSLMAAGALGIPLWGLISLIAFPLLAGQRPEWGAEQMRAQFPALVGWIAYGASLGLFTQAFSMLAARILGPEVEPAPPESGEPKRIVILGGGLRWYTDSGTA